MDDADGPRNRIHLHCHGEIAKRGAKDFVLSIIEVQPPATTIFIDPEIELHRVVGIQRELFMVSTAGVKPGEIEPFNRFGSLGTTIDEIADREQPIAFL